MTRLRLLPLYGLGTIALAAVAFVAATLVAMHVLQPELDPLDYTMSEYANGRLGWLMQVAWIVGGVGLLALAVGLQRSLPPGKRRRVSVVLMAFAGLVGFITSGIFKTDPPLADGTTGYTSSGQIHDLAGLLGLVAVITSAFVLRGAFTRDPRWRPLARPARWLAWAIVLGFVASSWRLAIRREPGASPGWCSGSTWPSSSDGSPCSDGVCAGSGARRQDPEAPGSLERRRASTLVSR